MDYRTRLSRLQGSFRVFTDEQLPKLFTEEITGEEIHALLLDIGEEFRHILYHIDDSKFYIYLLEAPVREI